MNGKSGGVAKEFNIAPKCSGEDFLFTLGDIYIADLGKGFEGLWLRQM